MSPAQWRSCATVVALALAAAAPPARAQVGAPWTYSPSITVVAKGDDPRIRYVDDAVAYWNAAFAELGSAFRIGAVTRVSRTIPEDALRQVSAALVAGSPVPSFPDLLDDVPGDLVVFLADAAFVSYAALSEGGRRRYVAIRGFAYPPMNLPNVAPNVVAHEMGHALGLGHNADPKFLMCGRPAPCRPGSFRSEEPRMFPLTEDERQQLVSMYPRPRAAAPVSRRTSSRRT